ncbi:MAG: DUF255 domain-containing protein [Saprospiraceae bacterium]|nr:DUF255 domain-containing protein [Saprospiraceae bacterium]MCB0575306.1 DUF255 domain-containing protein [Saprospiraceae bacterium]MCB9355871.1 DUF255 domain-containing protein [Lewinellaceae bacterium]
MQKVIFGAVSFLMAGAVLLAFTFRQEAHQPASGTVKWYTWEEAVELNKTAPKKIFVDVYTDWCGWCKHMDKTTFVDSTIAAYLTANFYPVKLNAEQKGDIEFNGQTFKYMETGNGRGVHTLAYSLLDGNMQYPCFVYLTENFERIMISPGFKEPKDIIKEFRFAAEEQYGKTTWEKFRDEN